jgi:CO/xanthine dehydrogenase Mo-binding subunit
MSMHLEASLDEGGRIVDWRHDLWSCTHTTRPGGAAGAGHLLAARQVENSVKQPDLRTIPLPSGGMDRNAVPIYAIPNYRVIKHFVKEMPLRVSALRGLGAYANVFAIESFMDELAALSGTDPLAFRLKHLEDDRAFELLTLLGENAEWLPTRDKDGVHGRGIGFARYKNLSSWCGVVADVSVDSSTGVVTVQRVTGVVDAGQAINPDGILNQIEGGIVQGASWTLKEQVQHDESGTHTRDWASYPILRFSEVPEVYVEVINRPELPSLGAGESAQGPIAAAIGNAVADAAGIRLRDLPLTPEKVREAIMAKTT